MILFDEEGKLIYPEGSEELEDSVKKHITFKKSERIQLYNMKTYLYGHFSFQAEQKKFHMIVGPCGVIGSKETSCFFMGHEYHYDIHYSKEDKYSFEEYIQLLYTILTQKATTKDELAAITEKHKNHLCSHFKKEMGTTVHRYIQEKKISEAKHLLLFTDHSYDEVGNLLAFSSQSHFIQSFKKITGYTPKEYKSLHYAHSLV